MSEVLITDIVTDDINGTGIFDTFMNAIEIRLADQYGKQRISGADYASVYLGAMQTALQQSIAFALGREQADKQADLLANQGAEVLASTLRNNNLTTSTIAKDTQETLEVTASTIRNDLGSTAQIAKTVNDTAEVAATTVRNDSIASAQVDKVVSEKDLLTQKKYTEEAQTLDTVNSLAVSGLIGKQKTLYTNQSEGFLRQAEQKGAKVFTDLWTIAKSTSPDDIPLPYNADQASIDVILEKIAAGIGISKTDLNVTSKILGVSQNNPASITVLAHGLTTGNIVRITGVVGMPELNNNEYAITSTGTGTFTLNGVDSTAFTEYTSGGIITRV